MVNNNIISIRMAVIIAYKFITLRDKHYLFNAIYYTLKSSTGAKCKSKNQIYCIVFRYRAIRSCSGAKKTHS